MVNNCHAKPDTKTCSITYNPSLPGPYYYYWPGNPVIKPFGVAELLIIAASPLWIPACGENDGREGGFFRLREDDGREGGAKTPLERNTTGDVLVNTYMSDLSIQSAGRRARDASDLCDFASLNIKAKQPWNRPEFIPRNSATNDMLVFHL